MTQSSIIQWLSSPDNPPVRYLTARDLLPRRPAERTLKSLRRKALDWKPLQEILALQQEDGGFPTPAGKKTSTAEPTYNALSLMNLCGMDIRDAPVCRGFEHVTGRYLVKGTFSYTTGGSGILPCYVGLFTKVFIDMMGTEDPAVRSSIQWIVDFQRFDHKKTRSGGRKKWSYKAVDSYGGCWWSVSCYHGVVATFAALAAIPPRRRSSTVEARLKAAVRYLTIHRVYKESGQDKPLFRHMTQFFLSGGYRSHLIDVLEGIAGADPTLIKQQWVREAVDTVDAIAAQNDGRIPLVKNYNTKLVDPLPFEPVGKPSRFLTYRWLRVRQRFGL